MKRTILSLVLVVMLVGAAIACEACTKKEEVLVDGKVSYTIVNNTGKNVTAMTLSDTRGENKVESKAGGSGLPDGQSIALELPVKLEKNAPDVMFGFTVEGGDNVVTHIMQRTGTITMLIKDGALISEISEPGK